jgi:hypothetical protein
VAYKDGKKSGGRSKGTKNKRSIAELYQNVHEKAARLNIDPYEVLLLFAGGCWRELGYESETMVQESRYGVKWEYTIDPAVRANAAKEACKYIYPQKKSVEIKGDQGNAGPLVQIYMPANQRDGEPKKVGEFKEPLNVNASKKKAQAKDHD